MKDPGTNPLLAKPSKETPMNTPEGPRGLYPCYFCGVLVPDDEDTPRYRDVLGLEWPVCKEGCRDG